jgi:hypothetical protein
MVGKVSYGGWPNCNRIADEDVEFIVATDVGPRVIRCASSVDRTCLRNLRINWGVAAKHILMKIHRERTWTSVHLTRPFRNGDILEPGGSCGRRYSGTC